ncbi:ATP-binding protein [Pararhizobium sp. BT-229]|uniref:ATP-binding protein n=1 Tax=Pararhizobium sp. BT-229 TaxID=2986923 RepID=UPI0021F6AAA0|nr:ATP-binding protein [Pararhizobium sp. BT-229]MCV9964577.1 ATP-binding protein [Pararhizobium sp. BT-229]
MAKNAYIDGRMHELWERYEAEPCWDDLCAEFPVLAPLAACKQDKRHHGEIFVDKHTRMVIHELLRDPEYAELDDTTRFLMFWTAVFHDSGKPERTKTEEDGSITSRGHSRAGASIARREMMAAGMPYAMREHMCSLILAHQIPFWLYEHSEADQTKKAIKLAMELDPRLLIMHARADARGRICHDPDDIRMRVELSREVFVELGIYEGRYPFANEESMLAYVRRDDRHPAYEAYMDFACQGTIMCGIQGVGKDTWIAENMPGIPVVSLDDMREEMDVEWTDNQGRVVQAVLEAAKSHLRAKRDFVWNATNITSDQREKVISLLRDYNARVRIVYLEAPTDVLFKQNAERAASVPEAVIERFLAKLEPPKDWEAHEVVRVIAPHPVAKRRNLHQPKPPSP